jgi:glycosyltransferase involved in cell wall biosynthesis
MLSAVIATNDSERALVPTLACLVPGVTAGILRDVIVADAGSSDATAEVADIAGCRLIVAPGPLGARLMAAAHSARGSWLLFLRAGMVLEHSWVAEAVRFIADNESSPQARAAIFRAAGPGGGMRSTFAEVLALLRFAFARRAGAEQGLLIARSFYRQLGGHRNEEDPETELLRRLGPRRTIVLRCLALPVRPAIA